MRNKKLFFVLALLLSFSSVFAGRYYDASTGRWLQVDPLADNYPSWSPYNYTLNNPIKNVDPDGKAVETALDVISVGISAYDMYQNPSWENAGWLLADVAGAVLPFVPAAGLVRHAGKIDDVVDLVKSADKVDDAVDAVKAADKVGDVAKASDNTASALKQGDNAGSINVTPDGVALPADPKYQIPGNYVENPNRKGSYGVLDNNGKFQEKLRIDPATAKGKKGPDYSHYHKNGKKEHHSPRKGDKDPGFQDER